jgi:hypothetical protein
MEASFTLSGDRELLHMFAELPRRVQTRVLKPLLGDASQILVAAEQAEAPRLTGLLAEALGAGKFWQKHGTMLIATGARHGFLRQVRAPGARFSRPQDPAKYMHLVSGGRKALTADRGKALDLWDRGVFRTAVKKQEPNPFMDRAMNRAAEQVASQITSRAPALIEAEAATIGA